MPILVVAAVTLLFCVVSITHYNYHPSTTDLKQALLSQLSIPIMASDKGDDKSSKEPVVKGKEKAAADKDSYYDDVSDAYDPGAIFRGIAAATRKLLPVAQKTIHAKRAAAKTVVRTVGQNRPLAFASEGAVAGQSLIPKAIYYGAWTLSGVAITADITTKYWDAPVDKKWQTCFYWTAFHVPASLVVPAYIIHQIVHAVEHSVETGAYAKAWPPRAKALAPVGAALLGIIPVVPVVDTAAEYIMEPTLGKYLGLKFSHDHGVSEEKPKKE